MRCDLRLSVHHEGLAAQDQEGLAELAEIRREFLDDAAHGLEAAHGLRAERARFPVHRKLAVEIGGEGDAFRTFRLGCRHGIDVGAPGRVIGQRVERAPASHRVQEQRQIRHVPRHRSLHRQRGEEVVHGPPRHPSR